MSAPEAPHRLTPTERLALADARLHEVTMATLRREPAAPESTVEIGTTAKHGSAADPTPRRLHTWTITVRGTDAAECAREARRLDNELAAAFASELADDTPSGGE